MKSYNELRNIRTHLIEINNIALIKFPHRRYYERQQIRVFFYTGREFEEDYVMENVMVRSMDFIHDRYYWSGAISIRVDHTERTWADDIVAILDREILKTKLRENKVIHHIVRFRLVILTFISAMISLIFMNIMTALVSKSISDVALESQKRIADIANLKDIPQSMMELGRIIVNSNLTTTQSLISTCVALLIAAVLGSVAFIPSSLLLRGIIKRSRILFTKADIDYVEKADRKAVRGIILFVGSAIVALSVNILSTILMR